jgi:nucleotide-binding universal stress UspA family protein
MKVIIACTDFSPHANSAVTYAAALAADVKARLILFHHFDYPIPATDIPGAIPEFYVDEIAGSLEHRLNDIKTELARTYTIDIQCKVRSFSLNSDLEDVFRTEDADLVVMGTQGQNVTVNVLFGRVAAGVIRRGHLPLLLLPQGVVYRPLKRILFAYDNRRPVDNFRILEPLRFLASAFDAYIEVFIMLDMDKKTTPVPNADKLIANNLEVQLAHIRHSYTYEGNDDISGNILERASSTAADLVAMIPHHHAYLSALLHQSETQRIVTMIKTPLLVLGEKII